ncbi:uncharacterized protein [Leptinotarsa decemlineata]|uniref:uncharacterized protein n=1 Tax=Leptinotarsa decemlineata TaxID=7539 RepID=UPI003D308118
MSEHKKFAKKPVGVDKKAGRIQNLHIKTPPNKLTRSNSIGALEELVQCGICLEKLRDPRMLPCQHTFCLVCLQNHLTVKNLKVNSNSTVGLSPNIKFVRCPLCQHETTLENGFKSLDALPKNFYIDSLLKLLQNDDSPKSPTAFDFRCSKCQIVSEKEEHVCQHCMKIFCSVCWNQHISELDTNLSVLVKEIEESGMRLKHKADNFASRCDQLEETIKEIVEEKISKIRKMEESVLNDVSAIKTQSDVLYENIKTRMDSLKNKIQSNINETYVRSNKISTYMNLHRETAKLFEEIYHYGEARIVFDSENMKIDQDQEGIYNDIGENNSTKIDSVVNPYESVNSMIKHYKTRSFQPKLLWTKCPRPGAVGIAPWDSTKIYVAATDSKNILILDRSKFKLVGRINNPEMICPTNIAFSLEPREIFVSDKWKNCIHVFSSNGEYLRTFDQLKLRSPDGVATLPSGELIICDTGNNHLVVVDSKTGHFLKIIGKGNLQMPTSVAVYKRNIIVSDTGNHKIKFFNMDGQLLQAIGGLGRGNGQFRSAEVVTVDCMGFILVGDAGNARIQVFQPNGDLVKIFGSNEGFGWISGICVSPELDIITTDSKNRNLRIF